MLTGRKFASVHIPNRLSPQIELHGVGGGSGVQTRAASFHDHGASQFHNFLLAHSVSQQFPKPGEGPSKALLS